MADQPVGCVSGLDDSREGSRRRREAEADVVIPVHDHPQCTETQEMVRAPRGYTRLSVAYKWPFPQDVACIAKALNISIPA